jgi:hypothetical protein
LCGGSGSVARASFADSKNDISVNCHICKGTGKLYDKDAHISALQQQLAETEKLLSAEYAMRADENERRMKAEQQLAERDALPTMLMEQATTRLQRIHELEAQLAERDERTCQYEQVDGSSMHLTSCGHEFHLDAGMDLYDYCPHCGGSVETAPPATQGGATT